MGIFTYSGNCNVLLGIVILINPQNTAVFVTRITGIILTYSGVVDLITTLTVSGKIRRWVDDNAIIDTESRDIDGIKPKASQIARLLVLLALCKEWG